MSPPRVKTLCFRQGILTMKATAIRWDTDGDESLAKTLPSEIEIPDNIALRAKLENDEDVISDYLSQVTGFCHYGYNLSE